MQAGADQAVSLLQGGPRASAFLHTATRYALSVTGPVAVSAAHFIASLIFLRLLQAAEFGQFSFLLIVVPFCLSAAIAPRLTPTVTAMAKAERPMVRLTG